MCGRTACCRCSNDYKKATSYFNEKSDKYEQSDWMQYSKNTDLEFRPSPNIAPTDAVPVLISGKHCDSPSEQILIPMIWSLIPRWHKGEYNKHGLSTNNARLDGLISSKLYSSSLKKGQRCVVVSDGFYEWKKTGYGKQPYFVYAKQTDGIRIEEELCWDNSTWDECKGWTGPNVLKMAGLFDIWTSANGQVIPSCTVITMNSSQEFSLIHERMPAVLNSEDAVKEWLDSEGTSLDDALNLLKPSSSIQWHPVTSKVGNSRYKEADSCKPVNINKRASENAEGGLMSWLKTGSLKSTNKKPRTE